MAQGSRPSQVGPINRFLRVVLLVAASTLVLIQLVPYGRDHTNPPVIAEPAWDSPRTRQLAIATCFDCHSNETVWPWYSNVAPASWLLQRDVDEGRESLNLSEWSRSQEHADHAAELTQAGEMPPWYYISLHPAASLSSPDKEALVSGFLATLGGELGGDENAENAENDD